jgi:5'-3' exonuclease
MSLMLVDAASLYFRAFHGVPESIVAPDGRPVNAVRGFLDMTSTLVERRRPTRYVACLDLDWRPRFRVDLLPSYKAHRVAPGGGETIPAALVPQVGQLLEVLAAFGLQTAGGEGFEADDVIATLAARDTDPVDVVTGDRDLLALATERVTVLYTGRGVAKLAEMGPAEVREKYGIAPEHYPDFAVLRGDPSDGLPGVPGIGEKTAAAIVSRFGAVEEILLAAAQGSAGFPSGAHTKILASRDYLAKAPAVVRGRIDVPVPELDDAILPEPDDPDRLAELAADLGIEASVQRLSTAIRRAVR